MAAAAASATALPAQQKIVLKVILLGNSGVGKTCILNRYVDNTFNSNTYKATIGTDFKLKELVIDGQPVTLQIWDTAGQERFQSLGEIFHRGANICLLVFDITKKESFEALQQWKDEFLLSSANEMNDEFPFACVANKVDRHTERTVSQKRAVKWCNHAGQSMTYFETSAKDSTNVAQAFTTMARKALKYMADSQKTVTKMYDTSKDVVLEQRRSDKKGCCAS